MLHAHVYMYVTFFAKIEHWLQNLLESGSATARKKSHTAEKIEFAIVEKKKA